MSLTRWAVMRVGTVCLGATLLQAGPLHAGDHAGDKTDVLYMNNGDRLTCEIKSLDAGALYIGLDYVDGTITVNWSKVRRLESKRDSIAARRAAVFASLTPAERREAARLLERLAAATEDLR